MLALTVTDQGVKLLERPSPSLRSGEVLVKVKLAGICATDLEIARGYMGFRGVIGHEVLGEIDGRRVVLEINCSCGSCAVCRGGGKNHCPTRTVLGILGRDGGLGQEVAIPIENVHHIPDSIPDECAVFVEPLAAALHAFDDAAPRPGDRVAILGDGKLGLLCALGLASRRGDLARAVLIGKHREKLAFAETAGLEVWLADQPLKELFDIVVDATGEPEGLARALALLRPRGTLVLKSTHAEPSSVNLAPIVINEVRVIGSRCGDFSRAIDALARGVIDPRPLISRKYPLAEAERAFEEAGRPGVLKILIAP